MILLKNINLALDTDFSKLEPIVAKAVNTDINNIISAKLYKKSVDARDKKKIVFCCSFLVEAKNEKKILKFNKKAEPFLKKDYEWKTAKKTQIRPVIVGFGPAGIFAALTLCKAGIKPIIIERGKPVNERIKDVEAFFAGGELKVDSNIQFGEGGAGTFSDGKLNTGIKDVRIRAVLEIFAAFGANDKILYEAKPHIGTDVLRNVIQNIRNEIIALGGEIHFNSKLSNVFLENSFLKAIEIIENGEVKNIPCSHLILAIGHSARDTYKMLNGKGIAMERKPFSVGSRIEHKQSDINASLYGDFANHKALGAADYKMAVHLENGRGVYTFCMCPGGEVVNASSEEKAVCVNGMSFAARDGENANSALLVEVRPEDLKGTDVLEGINFQREIESKAYSKNGNVPFCFVGDLYEDEFKGDNSVKPTVLKNALRTDINSVLPDFVVNSLKKAIPLFAKKIDAF